VDGRKKARADGEGLRTGRRGGRGKKRKNVRRVSGCPSLCKRRGARLKMGRGVDRTLDGIMGLSRFFSGDFAENTCPSTDHEGRAEEAEFHKQDQLQKQKEGKGHWKDELASDSESIVCSPLAPPLPFLSCSVRSTLLLFGEIWYRPFCLTKTLMGYGTGESGPGRHGQHQGHDRRVAAGDGEAGAERDEGEDGQGCVRRMTAWTLVAS